METDVEPARELVHWESLFRQSARHDISRLGAKRKQAEERDHMVNELKSNGFPEFLHRGEGGTHLVRHHRPVLRGLGRKLELESRRDGHLRDASSDRRLSWHLEKMKALPTRRV